jgi:hypothetical protein
MKRFVATLLLWSIGGFVVGFLSRTRFAEQRHLGSPVRSRPCHLRPPARDICSRLMLD